MGQARDPNEAKRMATRITQDRLDHLKAIAARMNESDDYYASIPDDIKAGQPATYLLRYDKFGPANDQGNRESMGLDMVVMDDNGITWEPSGYTRTEQYGVIAGNDVNTDKTALVDAIEARLAELLACEENDRCE